LSICLTSLLPRLTSSLSLHDALPIFLRLVDLYWLIAPEFHPDGISLSWLDILLPASLFSIWLGCFVWQLRGRAILPLHEAPEPEDRKSTRLNSSHQIISYAVFCLKKK